MTEDYKEQLIEKMLDAPGSLSDGELNLILHDEELREIYETAVMLTDSFAHPSHGDVAEQWASFRPKLRRRRALPFILRVAAIFLGVILLSGIIIKFKDNTYTPKAPAVIAKVAQPSPSPEPQQPCTEEVEPVTSAEVTLPEKKSSRPSGTRKRANTPPPCEPEIDVDEYLRIQQAKVDNDIACQQAALNAEKLLLMAQILEGDNLESSKNIQTVIMQ